VAVECVGTSKVVVDDRINKNRPPKDVMERDLQIDTKPYRITADLRRKDSSSESRFRYEVSLEGFPRMRARFFRRNNASTFSLGYRISFRGLVEYNSTGNGTVGTDFDRSLVVQELSLVGTKSRWTAFVCRSYPTPSSTARQCNSTYTNPAFTNLNILLSVYLTPKEFHDAISNRTFSPNMLIFDLTVNKWPFKSPSSKLAFVVGIHTRVSPFQKNSNYYADEPDKEGAVKVSSSSDYSGDQFGYAKWVQVGSGVYCPLAVSQLLGRTKFSADLTKDDSEDDDNDPSEQFQLLLFTVDTTAQPSSIYWDPSLSMEDSGALPLAISGVVLMFSVLFGLLF